jgi:hypothetical protein
VLDSDFLLAFAPISLESFDLHCEGPKQLDGEIAVTVLYRNRLGAVQPAQSTSCSEVRRYHLYREHGLNFILRSNTGHGSKYTIDVLAWGRAAGASTSGSVDDRTEH